MLFRCDEVHIMIAVRRTTVCVRGAICSPFAADGDMSFNTPAESAARATGSLPSPTAEWSGDGSVRKSRSNDSLQFPDVPTYAVLLGDSAWVCVHWSAARLQHQPTTELARPYRPASRDALLSRDFNIGSRNQAHNNIATCVRNMYAL